MVKVLSLCFSKAWARALFGSFMRKKMYRLSHSWLWCLSYIRIQISRRNVYTLENGTHAWMHPCICIPACIRMMSIFLMREWKSFEMSEFSRTVHQSTCCSEKIAHTFLRIYESF
jgi:hypothetical protein